MTVSEFLEFFSVIIFLTVSIRLIQIDLRVKRLPNLIVLPALLVITFLLVISQYLREDLGGLFQMFSLPLLVTFTFFLLSLFYPKGLGMGDIKVVLLIGITLSPFGSSLFFISLCFSFIGGAIFGLFVRIRGGEEQEFAFGPFLLLPAMAILPLQLFFS